MGLYIQLRPLHGPCAMQRAQLPRRNHIKTTDGATEIWESDSNDGEGMGMAEPTHTYLDSPINFI